MGELAGWPYWKVISVTGQSGAGTDYQVELEIGDSAGGDFHLEGHCTNFPQDIRITDDDGTTLLDHWVEDITADPIIVHVEVKDDLGSNRDVRVYYGKSGETTASSGADTFIQYHGYASSEFYDTEVKGQPLIAEFRAKATAASHNIRWGVTENNLVSPRDSANMAFVSTGTRRILIVYDGSGTNSIEETPSLTVDQYYRLKIVMTPTAIHGYVDGNEIVTGISKSTVTNNQGLFMKHTTGTGTQEWSFIRKYNSPEPAFSSAGAEQTPTVGAIMNQFQRANIGADLYNGVFA